ncbi:hypothetical protein [Roseomonas harenae]|uniref:hypothetical protein n=1 Tax=Muricoccus harenae TaxID=2692566 RepID=UPI0013318BE7|nr:hypothetical protein [Roseomonas harenae]
MARSALLEPRFRAAGSAGDIALHLAAHAWKRPDFEGWWAGFDQRAYLTAAHAWAAGDLTPGLHHYLAGYQLLAAPFVGLLPAQPFVIADLACALLSLFLLVATARRLAPDEPWVPAMGALAFLIVTMSSRAAVSIWAVPWSTTPAVPLILALWDLHPTSLWRYLNHHYFKWVHLILAFYAL